jgi:hypothetical protein
VPEIRAVLAATLQASERGFAAALTGAAARGDFPAGADLELRAELAAAVLHSIALRARAGEDRTRLERFARRAAAQLCGDAS